MQQSIIVRSNNILDTLPERWYTGLQYILYSRLRQCKCTLYCIETIVQFEKNSKSLWETGQGDCQIPHRRESYASGAFDFVKTKYLYLDLQ